MSLTLVKVQSKDKPTIKATGIQQIKTAIALGKRGIVSF